MLLVLLSQDLYFGELVQHKLQYFGHLMPRADSSEKTMMLGKIEGRRRRRQRVRWLDGITDSMDMDLKKRGRSWRTETPRDCSPWGQRVGHDLATEQQQ